MTDLAYTTNPTPFLEGDYVALREDLHLRPLQFTIPAGEIGRVIDVDPDDESHLLLQMLRHFDELNCWRNLSPARSHGVRLMLRVVSV
jgi:hypothetical protein